MTYEEMRGTVLRIRKKKTSSSCVRSPHNVLTTTRSRKKSWKQWRIVKSLLPNRLKSLYLERIGRPDILWSVDKLARAVTKWTRACDRRLARLISYIRNTSRYKHSCHVGNAAEHCRLGLFQDSHFAGDLEDSKSTPGGFYVFSGVKRSFQKVGCARSKLQFHTFLLNLRPCPQMLAYA